MLARAARSLYAYQVSNQEPPECPRRSTASEQPAAVASSSLPTKERGTMRKTMAVLTASLVLPGSAVAQDAIRSAMSAAPTSISAKATIRDWEGKCRCYRPGWLGGHDDNNCEYRNND